MNESESYQWVKNFSKQMMSEVFVMINTQKENKDPAVMAKVLNAFLASFIGSVAMTALSKKPEEKDNVNTKEELVKFTQNALLKVKHDVAESVATGFEAAMHSFCGRDVEYYCTIKPVTATKSLGVH